VLAALCLTVTTRANATLMAISFDDGGNNVGTGVIDVESGYAVSGDFTVTAGLAAGDWTLFDGTAASAGAGRRRTVISTLITWCFWVLILT